MKVTCPQCKRRVNIKRGEEYTCKCNQKINYMKFFKKRINYIVYLADANIFIYSDNEKDFRHVICKKVFKFDNPRLKIGTTDVIIDEIKENQNINIPDDFLIYKIGKISDYIRNLKTNYLKQPSKADLSLLQAAINHPEIKGIITYDRDFGRIATKGVIQKKSSSDFWLGNAAEFLRKYKVKIDSRM